MTDDIFRKPLPPTPVLETARLILRPLAERDVPAIQRIFPQWEVVRYLNAQVPWPYPEDGAATNTAMCLEKRAKGEQFYWAITLKGGDDELRGRIDLWPDDGARHDMRGFWLDPLLHGQGLMTEAAEAVTGYAFRVLGWPYLYLTNAVQNRASRRVKEKQGAEHLGVEAWPSASGPGERDLWKLTREAWLARNGN
jgi:ribosomal-protein-alanine N-acetyltransferase